MDKAKYCSICGYVNTKWNEEKCPYCDEILDVTDETYNELQTNVEDDSEIPEYIRQMYVYSDEKFNEDKYDFMISNVKPEEVACPYCGSTQIQMVNRKWSLLTGFMTNKVDRVCVNCMKKF